MQQLAFAVAMDAGFLVRCPKCICFDLTLTLLPETGVPPTKCALHFATLQACCDTYVSGALVCSPYLGSVLSRHSSYYHSRLRHSPASCLELAPTSTAHHGASAVQYGAQGATPLQNPLHNKMHLPLVFALHQQLPRCAISVAFDQPSHRLQITL